MAMLDDIGQEKLRISERLARLDAERTRLGGTGWSRTLRSSATDEIPNAAPARPSGPDQP